MPDQKWKVSSSLAIGVITVLLGAAISFNAWAVASMYERPTTDEVKTMIEEQSPYVEDRNMIVVMLKTIQDDIEELKAMIRNK